MNSSRGGGAEPSRVAVDRGAKELGSFRARQVEGSLLSTVPRAQGASEHHAVTAIEKHLRRTAGSTRIRVAIVLLEHKTEVANAWPDARDLPRPAASFIKRAGTQVPRDIADHGIEWALGVARARCEVMMSDGALANNLSGNARRQELRLELVMEVCIVLVWDAGRGDLREETWGVFGKSLGELRW